MKKISKPSIAKELSATKAGKKKETTKFYDSYYDIFTFKVKPIPEVYIERLAQELIAWSNLEDSLRLNDFINDKGMESKDFYRFCSKHRCLDSAREFSLSKIASRREIGALKNKYNAAVMFRTQAHYDPIYKEQVEWNASLKQPEAQAHSVIEVRMKDYKDV